MVQLAGLLSELELFKAFEVDQIGRFKAFGSIDATVLERSLSGSRTLQIRVLKFRTGREIELEQSKTIDRNTIRA